MYMFELNSLILTPDFRCTKSCAFGSWKRGPLGGSNPLWYIYQLYLNEWQIYHSSSSVHAFYTQRALPFRIAKQNLRLTWPVECALSQMEFIPSIMYLLVIQHSWPLGYIYAYGGIILGGGTSGSTVERLDLEVHRWSLDESLWVEI